MHMPPCFKERVGLHTLLPVSLLRFLLVGVVNTLAGLSAIFGAKILAGFDDSTANATGYAVGLMVSFILNKRWTFSFHAWGLAPLLRFIAVFVVAYAANLVLVLWLIDAVGLNPFWSQTIGVIPYSTLFYVGCRWYAFPEGALVSRR